MYNKKMQAERELCAMAVSTKIRKAIFVDNIAICIYLLKLWRSIIRRIVNMPNGIAKHKNWEEILNEKKSIINNSCVYNGGWNFGWLWKFRLWR